ncbi:uncharacterized protein A4U43_UnF11030 [Asparagus officinalis]|uniref:Uncharacterized protein n=1 Tax=Asparagus officinalis TaxID=4686 RepID=A0A1R3L5D2_ASPOF|nr:uncharacterized protein A4U43_UnF11030 [Asparagus officinalis]
MGLLVTQLNRLENMGSVDESSPGEETTAQAVEEDAVDPRFMPESSRRPGKELVGGRQRHRRAYDAQGRPMLELLHAS